jgi:alpha-glucosidase
MKSTKRFQILRSIPLILMIAAFPLVFYSCSSNEEISVISPDRMNNIVFILDDGKAYYKVIREGATVIDSSSLGFEFSNDERLTEGFRMKEARITGDHNRWETSWGQQKRVLDWHSKLTVILEEKKEAGRTLEIDFIAFNDGVAFRYRIPEQEGLSEMMISKELTEFRFSAELSAWFRPGDVESGKFSFRNTPLSEIEPAITPLILESTDSLFIRIHEAALVDYPGMRLRRSGMGPYTLECDQPGWPDGLMARVKAPFTSPWRTIQLSKTAGELIESDMILNLNEPSALEEETWVRPIKYIKAVTRFERSMNPAVSEPLNTTESVRRYIDFAAASGISAVMVEGSRAEQEKGADGENNGKAGSMVGYNLEVVAAYAREKSVFLIVSHETGGHAEYLEQQLDSVFAYYERLGIRAVKPGYTGPIRPAGQHLLGQWMVRHRGEVIKVAARHKLMIQADESTPSTGLERTWPNFMSGDYTFETESPSTLAKQLALMVVNFNPLQMTPDLTAFEQGHPAFQFIRDVPSDWDDTRVLDYKIGEYIAIARKKNNSWYIGSVTNENAREISLKLDFLEDGTEYEVVIYADGEAADNGSNPPDFTTGKKSVRKGDELKVRLARGGGQAVVVRQI